jgi:hypothetical protein
VRTIQTIILLACLVEACAAPGAWAQQPAPSALPSTHGPAPTGADDADKAAGAGQDKGAQDNGAAAQKPATPKSKLDPNSSLLVEPGYGDWGLRGNQTKFREYATPPHGFFLRDLRYAPLLKSPSENAFFELRGIGQDDYLASARGAWDYGATRAYGFLSRSRFFDPTPGVIPASTWQSSGVDVRRNITHDFSLSFQERTNSQQLNFALPYPRLDQNTDFWSAAAAGKLGRGYARLDFWNYHYADETGTLLNFDAQKVGLSYLWTPVKAVSIEAAAAHVNVRQPNAPSSHVDTLSLGGDFALGGATDLAVLLQRRQVGTLTVQNAYDRNQNQGFFSLSHRFYSWRAQVALTLQNDDRVNGTQTYVDVPKWSTVEGRLSGRLTRNWRLSLRGYTQSLSDPPASALTDPRTLYWTNRNFAEAKLEGGTENVNGYATYTYRVDRNYERSADVTTEQYTLGGSWQINPSLNLFAEYHHENWTGRTDSALFPALNNYLPDSDTGMVELNWYLGRRAYVAFSYTGFATYNDNPLLLQDGNTRGSFFTINTHYKFSAGYELGLLVSPWTYRDSVTGALNYDATVLMVTGTARF